MSFSLRQNPASENNFTVGRNGNAITEIVVHHAATTDFDGIARTFQNPARQASAHYGVGRNGNVDQYVSESDIAWHCGNWGHNSRSIGIENVNISGAPNWEIAPQTFETLVELCTSIAKRHGMLPLRVGVNLFGHKDVSDKPTACPFALHGRLQELADRVNAAANSATPAPSAPRKSNDVIASEVVAGAWGNGDDRKARLAAAGYDYGTIQAIVNNIVGAAAAQPVPQRLGNEQIADQVIAGAWGNGDDRRNRLAGAGYDYAAIQALVNQKLGIGATAPARKSNDQVANEVIVGSWGNGDDRKARLAAAGYDYGTIQAIVNRKLGF